MTLDQARTILVGDAPLADQLEAIAVVTRDPASTFSDLFLGLSHPECVAEQAALALYRRTGRLLPDDPYSLSTDQEDWLIWLIENHERLATPQLGSEHRNSSMHLRGLVGATYIGFLFSGLSGAIFDAMTSMRIEGLMRRALSGTACDDKDGAKSTADDHSR